MHIDHSKLIELVSEASGIEKEKVEKQLTELVEEIKQAIDEGEAYEVDGFGVFSGIGNNVIFIPSDELATEINYKYAGMEPIELSDSPAETPDEVVTEKAEQQTVTDEEDVLEDDPFAGLLDDVEDNEEEEIEDFTDETVAASPGETEEEKETEPETINDDIGDDIFDLGDEEEEEENAVDEEFLAGLEEELSAGEQPNADDWGIDSYKDEGAEKMFSGLLGDSFEEESSQDEEAEESEELFNSVDEYEKSLSESSEEKKEEDELRIQLDMDAEAEKDVEDENEGKDENIDAFLSSTAENDSEEKDDENKDFDDPFAGFLDDEDEEDLAEQTAKEERDEEEVVPVITNISSEDTETKPKEKKREKKKKGTITKQRQSSPAFLYVLIAVIVIGGGVVALGYFNVIHIPGISSTQTGSDQVVASTSSVTAGAVNDNENEEPPTNEEAEQAVEEETEPTEPATEEQTTEPEVTETEEAAINPDQPTYGLRGVPVESANNGYTIVVFSLSRESNAKAQQAELSNLGYRVLVSEIESAQYGRLWRVSLGQFASLRDAAIAAERLTEPYSENYFITNIQ